MNDIKKDSKELNKYVLRADADKNEWTFSGDIWPAIDSLIDRATLAERKRCLEILEGFSGEGAEEARAAIEKGEDV